MIVSEGCSETNCAFSWEVIVKVFHLNNRMEICMWVYGITAVEMLL